MRVANQEEELQFSVLYKHISILYVFIDTIISLSHIMIIVRIILHVHIGMICKAYMQYNNAIVHQ